MQNKPETQYYHHGTFHFEGGSIPDGMTAYRTHGDPEKPCIVFPTAYGGRLDSQYHHIGAGKPLDPSKYFIVTFALFSNGEPSPFNGPYFPKVSYADNIRAQHAVLTKKLGIKKVHCVVGFSMGGQQTYHWAIMYPEMVERFICICGSARTSPHNKCFIEGPKTALVSSRDFEFGHYVLQPEAGKRAFGRVYSAWAYGQTWFRQHQYRMDGKYPNLHSWLKGEWENRFLSWDANDMLVLYNTWYNGDISIIRDNGDYEKALKSIKAKALIMPCKTDLYFPPEDSEIEVSLLPNAKLVVIDSVWGHGAGGGANPQDVKFVGEQITAFLQE
ncbi:hypothetical protein M422DRAFT_60651 [Sphaerobolus stellatus SS14]|uniref:AB hydrolase-1 domain-containing protein n=1 Tax=Sphaerobolus stellatus (strain SS14) TaxID=990650 RepID=A0A0C9VP80_SPHS4|nr:hypothetical protein M422DRAFT_60651 [Sphaerobolus stellatus SS14]